MEDNIVFPIQMYDPTRDFKNYEVEYREAIDQVLIKGNFIGGEQINELEKKLSEYTSCLLYTSDAADE